MTTVAGRSRPENYLVRCMIGALCESRSVTELFSLEMDWLLQEERPLVAFLQSYHRNYRTLPNREVLAENGIADIPTVDQPARYYIDRIRDRYLFNTIRTAQPVFVNALNNRSPREALEQLRVIVSAGNNIAISNDRSDVNIEAQRFWDRYLHTRRSPAAQGLTLGFEPLDRVTTGVRGGDIIVLVARPGIGKSYVLLKMLIAAWLSGVPCQLITMEMTSQQFNDRLLGVLTGINPRRFRQAQLSWHAEQRVAEEIERISNLPPLHYLQGNLAKTVDDIDAVVSENRPDALYIDGGYLIKAKQDKGFRFARHEAVRSVIEDLKRVATNHNIPVFVTMQLNRQAEYKIRQLANATRQAQRAQQDVDVSIEDIGETDAIGQIASVVLAIRKASGLCADIQRTIKVIKNRDEETGLKFAINYLFNPLIDLSYIPNSENAGSVGLGASVASIDQAWMV